MQNMREELEDLAFAELQPEARNSIITRIAQLEDVRVDRVARIADQLKRSSPRRTSTPGSAAAPSVPTRSGAS